MKRRIPGSLFPLRFSSIVGCLFVLTALGAAGCERALLTAPSASVLTLTASATAVELNESVMITATVVDGTGAAVPEGTLVTFASTLGQLAPSEARVSNGRATIRLMAGTVAGIASVTASSGAIGSNILTVRIGPVPTRIVLTASAGTAGAALIAATVFDQMGLAVAGVPVTFTASSGTLANSVVYTDALGQAVATLWAVTDTTVTADAMGVRSTIFVRPGGSGGVNVNVTLNPATPARNQTVVFTATVSSGSGTVVPIQRYEWDWGGGFVVVTTGNTTSRVFSATGNYSLTVRVISVDGTVGTSRIEFYVS